MPTESQIADWFGTIADKSTGVRTDTAYDYRGNVAQAEQVTGTTEIREGPSGARFDRHFTFATALAKPLVRAKTTWAMVDRETGRVLRVPPEVAAPFLA